MYANSQGITELLSVHDPADDREQAPCPDQQVWNLAPAGQIQRRVCSRPVMRAHILSATKRLKNRFLHHWSAFWSFICAFCAFRGD